MAGLKDLFIPREVVFFEYLKTQVDLLQQATALLSIFTKHFTAKQLQTNYSILNRKIRKGNALSLLITQELHQTFITPIDRDEIQTLSFNLHRILHSIETIFASIKIYRIFHTNDVLKKQIHLLQQSVNLLVIVFQHPLSTKDNQITIAQIKKVEKKADIVFRKALTNLFIKSKDPIEIIKKKELFQVIEETIDKTEYIANIIQSVLINHG